MPNLWDVVDLPDRQAGEKGWGEKVIAIWRWKNELPAIFSEEIFYGKIPTGHAALMSMDYLRMEHYPKHHRPLKACSSLAQRIEVEAGSPDDRPVAGGIEHDAPARAESI